MPQLPCFTSESRIWFFYNAIQRYRITLFGDDDIWVFINGRLAIDLGGIHTPVEGTVALNFQTAGNFGMSSSGLYEIVIFHAERQTTSSTYALNLEGFGLTMSECTPE